MYSLLTASRDIDIVVDHKACEHLAGKGARISALGVKTQLVRSMLHWHILLIFWFGVTFPLEQCSVCVPVPSLPRQLFAPDSLLF